jgi:hypothetical protein
MRRIQSPLAGRPAAGAHISFKLRKHRQVGVLVPGGRLLLLDHIGSSWPLVHAAQWLLERITIRAAGEHFTRRQLPLVQAAGFQVIETERRKAGTVERIHAVKPA